MRRTARLAAAVLIGGFVAPTAVQADGTPIPPPAPAPAPAPAPSTPAPCPPPSAPALVPAPAGSLPLPGASPAPAPAPTAPATDAAPTPAPAADSTPAATLPVPQPAAVVPATPHAKLGEIKKEHNVSLGGGPLGLRLTVPVDSFGMDGHTLAVVVFFYDAAGNPIRATTSAYADSSRQARFISNDAKVRGNEAFDFVFDVPYYVFPRKEEGKYAVEGRIRLIDRTPTGKNVLASATITFSVEG